MEPVFIVLSPDEVAVIVLFGVFFLGVLFALLAIWALLEDHRDRELSQHVDDIFRRYM